MVGAGARGVKVAKGYLPEAPLENIPRYAIHNTRGKVRILAYHPKHMTGHPVDRFTVHDLKRNAQVTVPRESLRFIKEIKKADEPELNRAARRDKGKGLPRERYVPTPEQAAASERRRAEQAAAKEAKRHVVDPNTVHKVPLRSLVAAGPARKAGLSLAGLAAGVGALRYRHREVVKADSKRVDQAIGAGAGVAGANAASIVSGQGLKGYLTHQRGKHGETPAQQETWAQHKRQFGVTDKTEAKTANAAKFKIYSRYPKSLPHWKLQRALGYKNHPAAAAGVLVAGGLVGARQAGRSHDRHVTAAKADRKQAEATAAGAGAGAIAAPGRSINPRGRNLHPVGHLREGVHMVDPRDLARYARGTGVRFGERSHVASLAHSMKTQGYHPDAGPIHLNVYADRAKISDGAHRAHAASIAGLKKVPVHVHRTSGSAPSSWRGGQAMDYLRTQHQQTAYDRHVGDEDWMRRRARDVVKPGSWRHKINSRAAHTGAQVAEGPLKTLSHNRYVAANVGLIGAGGAIGHRLFKPKQVSKAMSYTDVQAHRARRRDRNQAALGAIEAGVALGGLKGRSLPARLAFAAPGLAASGQAALDLRSDEYGWTPKTRRERAHVGKSVEYGYRTKERSIPKTAEMVAGLGMLAYGVPRLRMLGPMARKGVKLADQHGAGKEARAALDLARAFGRKSKDVTGRGETQLRRVKTLERAIDAVPAQIRGEVATAAGALMASQAHPTTREQFTPTGRF